LNAWQPIAGGRLRIRAMRTVRELAAILAEPIDGASPSLALGDAGASLFFAYLTRAEVAVRHADERARFYALRAAGAIGQAPLTLGLFGGVTGIAWTLQHLRGVELPRRDLCAGIDAAVRIALTREPLDDTDLVEGLCGVGLYALARRNRALATAVVARLGAISTSQLDGMVWIRRDNDLVDLGTAHGLAGIAAMLAQARAAGIPGATRLSQRALRGLLGYARWDAPSVFSDRLAIGASPTGDCRLAWCYGDLGAACALQTAAEATRDKRLRATAHRLARHAAARSPASSGVVDCGVCHGSAGIALGLQRMHVASGDPALADAARAWLARALDDGLPDSITGAQATHARGLLTGGGLGLAYLAACTAVSPRWSSALAMAPTPGLARR
jgi:lantibiotic biosynthesis protein